MLRITDKGFQYTPSFSTDLKKRFKKMMREQQRAASQASKPMSPETALPKSVVPIRSVPKSS